MVWRESNGTRYGKDCLKNIRAVIDKNPGRSLKRIRTISIQFTLLGKEDKLKSYEHNLWLRSETAKQVMQGSRADWKILRIKQKDVSLPAQDDFYSYLIYNEWNRPVERRFYQPRMQYLQPMVRGYQDILDGKYLLITIILKRTEVANWNKLYNMISGRNPTDQHLWRALVRL